MGHVVPKTLPEKVNVGLSAVSVRCRARLYPLTYSNSSQSSVSDCVLSVKHSDNVLTPVSPLFDGECKCVTGLPLFSP